MSIKVELWIIGITGFLVWNTYHDGEYMKRILDKKKYFHMAGIGFAGLALLLFLKKYPRDGTSMMVTASSLMKYLPMDKHTKQVIAPVLDFTHSGIAPTMGVKTFREEMAGMNDNARSQFLHQGMQQGLTPHMARAVTRGVHYDDKQRMTKGRQKRSVSEAKKKYVASQQAWRCGRCATLLDATYEVDHKVALMHGGTNEVSNLEALCPNCHRKKTTQDRLGISGV